MVAEVGDKLVVVVGFVDEDDDCECGERAAADSEVLYKGLLAGSRRVSVFNCLVGE
jgi:hypothetical protein